MSNWAHDKARSSGNLHQMLPLQSPPTVHMSECGNVVITLQFHHGRELRMLLDTATREELRKALSYDNAR